MNPHSTQLFNHQHLQFNYSQEAYFTNFSYLEDVMVQFRLEFALMCLNSDHQHMKIIWPIKTPHQTFLIWALSSFSW